MRRRILGNGLIFRWDTFIFVVTRTGSIGVRSILDRIELEVTRPSNWMILMDDGQIDFFISRFGASLCRAVPYRRPRTLCPLDKVTSMGEGAELEFRADAIRSRVAVEVELVGQQWFRPLIGY